MSARSTVEHAGTAGEDTIDHAPFDPGHLEDGTALGSKVSTEQTKTARILEGLLDRVDHVLIGGRRIEPPDLFGQGLARAGHRVTLEKAGLEELADDDLQPALGVHVHHGVITEGPHVDQDGQSTGQPVEVLLCEDVVPQIHARRPGDLDAVQQHVGGTAHGDGDRQGIPQRCRRHDVAWPDAPARHCEKAVDHLMGEFGEPARIVRGRRDHVQRLETKNGDEGLHRVVGEHASAAALAGAGVQGESGADLGVLVDGLERRDQIDPGARLGIDPRADRTVGKDDRGCVVLEHGRDGPDRGLVAGHDGDEPGHTVGRQVHVGDVVDELSAHQREAHLRRAVELAVRDTEGERRWDQPDRQVVICDTARQDGLKGLDLLGDTQVALAVPEVADHCPDRIVDLADVLTEKCRGADSLHVAPGVHGHERGQRLRFVLHGSKLASQTSKKDRASTAYSAPVPTERESLLAAMVELDEVVGTVLVALTIARESHRQFGRLIARGESVENAFAALKDRDSRQPLNERLDSLEAARHRVRTGIVGLGLSEGLSISQLGRMFAFSRQLASRYAREARADRST